MTNTCICSDCEKTLVEKAINDFKNNLSDDSISLDTENTAILGDVEITFPYYTKEGIRFYSYYADINYCVHCGKKL